MRRPIEVSGLDPMRQVVAVRFDMRSLRSVRTEDLKSAEVAASWTASGKSRAPVPGGVPAVARNHFVQRRRAHGDRQGRTERVATCLL